MADGRGNPQNLKPLVAGTERAKQISAMGGAANKKRWEQKVDMQYLGERLGSLLLMYVDDPKKKKKLEKELNEIENIGELEGKNVKVVDKVMLQLVMRALSGEKRALSQILQIYENTAEQGQKNEDNGFIEALKDSSAGDWNV